ncbi:N-acetylmuramoyl-L-alanine amidase [Pseudomonas sp. Fl4BN1]|uniref:N-acetylmuramoyl-L-alanine amidase n=1 Tax=Pseudomonas sp. Fl4BN1 TaxID=2697651 RepID=UPI001378A2D2|nr:hypothetical protein [Pseudomonas sp. Fl4BN1]
MTKPVDYYFYLPPEARPSYSPLQEELHPDFAWLTQNRARSRGKDVFEAIDTVVIHATAGYATAHAVENWHQRVASAHWIIPDEREPQHGHFVWGAVAEAKSAYHVRDAIVFKETVLGEGPNVNNRSLGVEIVNTQDVEKLSRSILNLASHYGGQDCALRLGQVSQPQARDLSHKTRPYT